MGFEPLDAHTAQETCGPVVEFSINLVSVTVYPRLSKCAIVLFMMVYSRSSVFLSLRCNSPSDKKSNGRLNQQRPSTDIEPNTVHADSETRSCHR